MSTHFSAADVPDQSGRTALVTGANTGIGYEAALVLAGKGARVLLGCRSPEKGHAARDRILAAQGDADVVFVPLDLGSLDSIRKAADQLQSEARLDLLINNAGVMMPPRGETADGFETQFGVNHLGHFALTGRLLAKVCETPKARVVTVSSNGHKFGKIDFDDVHAERSYSRVGRYGMSKLANLLFTYELQRRFEARGDDVAALACHPGGSPTELSRHMPKWFEILGKTLLAPVTHPPPEGALPTVRAATDPAALGGQYYGPSRWFEQAGPPVLVESNAASHDRETARRLWDLSIELTGVDPGL